MKRGVISVDEFGFVHVLVNRKDPKYDFTKIPCAERKEERVSDVKFDSEKGMYYVKLLIDPRDDKHLLDSNGKVRYFETYDDGVEAEIEYYNEIRKEQPESLYL